MMGEHIFRVLLTDLTTVRIRCKKCGMITEVPTEELAEKFVDGQCFYCASRLTSGVRSGELGELAAALKKLRENVTLDIEFPITLPD